MVKYSIGAHVHVTFDGSSLELRRFHSTVSLSQSEFLGLLDVLDAEREHITRLREFEAKWDDLMRKRQENLAAKRAARRAAKRQAQGGTP